MDKLILIDDSDRIIGYEEKLKCHEGEGRRHRAVSIYIVNDKNELLIQKRSRKKLLWPEFWANSCCSHPRQGEEYIECGERRLTEEVGFSCKLKRIFTIKYKFNYKNIGSENEIDAGLFGRYNGEIKINPDEVAECKWADIGWLKKDIAKNKEKYAPWFIMCFPKFLKFIGCQENICQ